MSPFCPIRFGRLAKVRDRGAHLEISARHMQVRSTMEEHSLFGAGGREHQKCKRNEYPAHAHTVTPCRIFEKQIPSQDFTSGNDSMSPELLGAFIAGLTAGFTGSYFVTRMVVRGSILELRAELLRESQSIEHRLTAVESRLSQMEHHK
jgi:hypothetical protein